VGNKFLKCGYGLLTATYGDLMLIVAVSLDTDVQNILITINIQHEEEL
jgi:hypothetical protein